MMMHYNEPTAAWSVLIGTGLPVEAQVAGSK